jgi:hypothetical protein
MYSSFKSQVCILFESAVTTLLHATWISMMPSISYLVPSSVSLAPGDRSSILLKIACTFVRTVASTWRFSLRRSHRIVPFVHRERMVRACRAVQAGEEIHDHMHNRPVCAENGPNDM